MSANSPVLGFGSPYIATTSLLRGKSERESKNFHLDKTLSIQEKLYKFLNKITNYQSNKCNYVQTNASTIYIFYSIYIYIFIYIYMHSYILHTYSTKYCMSKRVFVINQSFVNRLI